MRNKHPGTCYRCGGVVDVGDGHFEKVRPDTPEAQRGQKWRLQHASCAIRYRGTDAHYQVFVPTEKSER